MPAGAVCCGQPVANAGFGEAGGAAAAAYERTFAPFDTVVTPSGSCAAHLQAHVRGAGRRTRELCRFLHDEVGLDRVAALGARWEARVGVHVGCHALRGLGLATPTERGTDADGPTGTLRHSVVHALLGAVEGLEVVELDRPDECCGFGGTFAVAEPAVSAKMGRDRLADHVRHGAEAVVSTDVSCAMHLEGIARRAGAETAGRPLPFLHPAQALMMGVRRPGPGMIPLPVLGQTSAPAPPRPARAGRAGRPVDHAANAARFTADAERTDWHDGALWHVREKRDRAVAAVPEWEALRDAASAIKEHTLSHLADVPGGSSRPRRPRTAPSSTGRATPTSTTGSSPRSWTTPARRRLVKSKSMLTEECALNPYLEARGVEVVDTDLGERIVQLIGQGPEGRDAGRGAEPPRHAGRSTLKKEEVGRLFESRLGTEPGNADPGYLTAQARAHLRAHFLGADAALTGVNFAVAETGEVVVCTNEGNADLGVHLAPVQIHSMGIEKVIPRRADLGVFTRLLARSATGQPVTVYTAHHRAPRPGARAHARRDRRQRADGAARGAQRSGAR